MEDANPAITAAERRGRALAQRTFREAGEEWRVDAADDADGHALLAAARAAGRFGAAVSIRLLRPDRPSAVWAALAPGAEKLGGRFVSAPGSSGLVVRRPDGTRDVVAAIPGADAAWRASLAESGGWVREARPGDIPRSCAQCREVDRLAIGEFCVPGVCLMENAAVGAAPVAVDMLPDMRGAPVFVAVGGGNNGGDGLAVARGLSGLGAKVAVGLLKPEENLSGDAGINMRLLRDAGGVDIVPLHADAAALARLLDSSALVIDALLGTGFRGSLSPVFRGAIEEINRCGRPVLALDLPSGMDGDDGRVAEAAVRAARTVTFAAVKTGLVAPVAATHVGRLYLADIGAPAQCLE